MWRVGPKQGQGLGSGRANAQDPQGWKSPVDCWGWALGSRNRRGPGMPALCSQTAWHLTWEPSRLPGLKWMEQMPSFPDRKSIV